MADAHEHISCQEVVELVTDYLEGALATEEGALFEQHLNFCDGCERYLDQMPSTVAKIAGFYAGEPGSVRPCRPGCDSLSAAVA